MRTLQVGLRVAELQSPETRGIEPLTPALQRCATASTSASTSITSSMPANRRTCRRTGGSGFVSRAVSRQSPPHVYS